MQPCAATMAAAHPCNRAPHRVDLHTLALNGRSQGAAQAFPQGTAQGATHVKNPISQKTIKSFCSLFQRCMWREHSQAL